MFSWATEQIERLSQTVAPPPQDASSLFVYSCQRQDIDGARRALAEIGCGTEVYRGQLPLHVACANAMPIALIDEIASQGEIHATDAAGNTALHHAALSRSDGTLDLVKHLVTHYKLSVLAKNMASQTPYDMAVLNSVRQYLLPLQLQLETQQALDNGGMGLPPGIDLGGLKIQNAAPLPPPPAIAMPPAPPQAAVPSAPSSSGSDYARVGYSSAAVPSYGNYKPDGFHSSSSDKRLQEKYGHAPATSGNAVPPPPHSGNRSAPPSYNLGANPYSAGATASRNRYVAYQPATTTTPYGAAPNAGTPYSETSPYPSMPSPTSQPAFTSQNSNVPTGTAEGFVQPTAAAASPPYSSVPPAVIQQQPAAFVSPPPYSSVKANEPAAVQQQQQSAAFTSPPPMAAKPPAAAFASPAPSIDPSTASQPPLTQTSPFSATANAVQFFATPLPKDAPPYSRTSSVADTTASLLGSAPSSIPSEKAEEDYGEYMSRQSSTVDSTASVAGSSGPVSSLLSDDIPPEETKSETTRDQEASAVFATIPQPPQEEESMHDVPLSPSTVPADKSNMLAAIGMPPPPFSKN